MFMSTTDDRNPEIILVINGHMTKSYRKLMYGQINDTKHTRTFISRPFGISLDLRSVDDFYFFFFFILCLLFFFALRIT